jgi:hypothetical protein
MKNIKGTSSLAGKNVQNSESIGNLTADTIRANTVISTNATITNLTNTELQTNTSDISTLQTSKQDTITDATDLEFNRLDLNDRIFFQHNDGTGDKCSIRRSNFNGRMTFTADEYYFKDEDDSNIFLIINTDGSLDCRDNPIDNVSDIDFNGSSLITQLSAKQDTITAGNGIDIVGTTISVDEAELTTKQDLIIDSTDIELNDLNVNDTIFFQRNDSSDTKTNITRSTIGGKMRFNADGYAFKDEVNGNNLLIISDSGTCTTTSVQADFFSSITDTELDQLDGITGNVQTQIDAKQDTITAGDGLSFTGDTLNAEVNQFELDQKQDVLTAGNGIDITAGLGTTISVDEAELTTKQDTLTSSTAISVASINLNSGNITNGGDGAFSTITLNGSDLQGKIDDKANVFGVNLPLELDGTAFPNPALKLNYNTTEFQLDGSDELALTGSLPTLTSALNCGTNAVTGITSLSCRSIELHNSTSGNSFLDFGGGDFRFRQIYSQTANTFTFTIDDATGENPETKMVISRTALQIQNANFDMNDQDIIGTKFIQGDADIKFYVNGDPTGGTDFTLDLKTDGDIDVNGGSLLNVEEVENSVKFVEYGGSPNSATNNLWGSNNIHNVWSEGVSVNATGMVSEASGVFTINEAGTYTIDCNATIENVDYNGRLVAGQYISVNDDTTRFRTTPSSFSITYVRDNNFGVAGSISFSTTIVLAQNDTIKFPTRLGKDSDNRAYDDTHSETGLNWWTGIRITRHLIA